MVFDCLLLILVFFFFFGVGGCFYLLSSEKYLQEVWPTVKSALKEYGVSCELSKFSYQIHLILLKTTWSFYFSLFYIWKINFTILSSLCVRNIGTHILWSRLGNLLGFCQEVSQFISTIFGLSFYSCFLVCIVWILERREIAIEMLSFVLTL